VSFILLFKTFLSTLNETQLQEEVASVLTAYIKVLQLSTSEEEVRGILTKEISPLRRVLVARRQSILLVMFSLFQHDVSLLSKHIASTCKSNFVIVLIKRQLQQEASRVNVPL
jgi:hypothetical protein